MKIKFHKRLLLFPIIAASIIACTPEEQQEELPTDPRDKYLGSWICSETSKTFGPATYTMVAKKNTSNSNQMHFGNFYQLGMDSLTKVDLNSNIFTIAQQTISGHIISGDGSSPADNKINFSFVIDDGGGVPDTVTAVLTKQ